MDRFTNEVRAKLKTVVHIRDRLGGYDDGPEYSRNYLGGRDEEQGPATSYEELVCDTGI
jgi:hypothetical protein